MGVLDVVDTAVAVVVVDVASAPAAEVVVIDLVDAPAIRTVQLQKKTWSDVFKARIGGTHIVEVNRRCGNNARQSGGKSEKSYSHVGNRCLYI